VSVHSRLPHPVAHSYGVRGVGEVESVGVCAGNGDIAPLTQGDTMTTNRPQFIPPHTPGVPRDAHGLRQRLERGAATAEYAIATMAAVGFAGLLVVIMRSDEVRGILTDLVRSALTFSG
jgi:hypothetical protein